MKLTIGLMIALVGGCLYQMTSLSDRDKELMRLESEGIRRELANDVLIEYIKGREVIVKPGMLEVASPPFVAAYHEKESE